MCHKNSGYPSDLTDQQWAIIDQLNINKGWGPGSPMRLELRAIINAIFYVLRTGCGWHYLPKDYPNHNSVYYHYHKWCWDGTWERVNTALRERVRRKVGRKKQPSLAIIDSQSVKTTEVGGARLRRSQEGQGAQTPYSRRYAGQSTQGYSSCCQYR